MKYRRPKPKRNPLRRKAVRRKSGTKPIEYLQPVPKKKGTYTQTKIYKHLWGHVIPEIVKKLPEKRVVCWINQQHLSLPICAAKKLWYGQKECKKCSLFQNDEHAQELKDLIEKWENDNLENVEE